ncbi:MAG: hypothetical protein CME19_01530 [Gemmatimonadetes bacterium]|nr:hypothetical protein [Gemmatimonadota bacterium]
MASNEWEQDKPHGSLEVVDANLSGGAFLTENNPHHFARRGHSLFYFIGDRAKPLATDDADEQHDRVAAQAMIDKRASQGYNVVPSCSSSKPDGATVVAIRSTT